MTNLYTIRVSRKETTSVATTRPYLHVPTPDIAASATANDAGVSKSEWGELIPKLGVFGLLAVVLFM